MHIASSRLAQLQAIIPVLAVATAYYITGRLSLLLAIPPGYATAVWPPAGIALAGVLVCGIRVWPGIVLGSLLINIWTSFDTTSVVAVLMSVALATSIGAGAALQALVGAFLVRRRVGYPTALEQGKEVSTFLLLGGPVSCLISATVGVATLLLGGVIPWAMTLFSWWTWWIGDTVGVLIVTPLMLTWTAEPRQIWCRRRLTVAVPLGMTLALSVVFFAYTSALERDHLRLSFERRASTLVHTLQNRLDGYLDVLFGIERFYASSREVDRQEFRTFVQNAFSRNAGLQALSWNPLVLDVERSAYEEAARRDGYTDFQITERNAQGQDRKSVV